MYNPHIITGNRKRKYWRLKTWQ